MLKHSLFVALTLCGILASHSSAAAQANANQSWLNWPSVGKADFNWLIFDVYQSELKVKTGLFQTNKAFNQQELALTIRYQRHISSEEFTTATIKQWQKIGYDPAFIEHWRDKLMRIFPSVVEGDELSMVTNWDSKSVILFKPESSQDWQELHRFNDALFTDRFLAIWLSENTQYPKLRQQLIGER
jgi:hypothetical protein